MKPSILLFYVLLSSAMMAPDVVRAGVLSVAMIKGTGVTSKVQGRIEGALGDLLRLLKLAEPADYDIYAPGETINATDRRRELLPSAEEPTTAVVAAEAASDEGRELQVKTCPSSCSTSSRTYCRSLGCAYCGKCRRRRRNLRGDLSLVGAVEFTLSKVVSLYCLGVVGCKLWVELLTVNDADEIFEPGMLVVRGATIDYVGPPVELPAGYERFDAPQCFAAPGMIDLHSHVQSSGFGDLNDMVIALNPEYRSSPTVVPGNPSVRRACPRNRATSRSGRLC